MKFRNVFAWFAALIVVAMTCQAQPPRGGNRSRPGNPSDTLFRLLGMQEVRTELTLRSIQIKMLDDLQADLGEQQRAAFSPRVPLQSPNEGRAVEGQSSRDRFNAMRNQIQKLRTEGEKLVVVILDDKQHARLSQLRLQDEGTRSFERSSVREQLNVTDEQFKKIQGLRRTVNDRSLSQHQRQQKIDKEVLSLLDEKQLVKFKELQGESFEFPLQVPADLRGLALDEVETDHGDPLIKAACVADCIRISRLWL